MVNWLSLNGIGIMIKLSKQIKKLVPNFLPEVPPVVLICLNYPILLFPQIFV